jgi:drug/metabolite transporter (DMT)-like permease
MIDEIKVKLKEYETLRQESLDIIKNRITIMSLGLTAIGALFAGSLYVYDGDSPSITIYILVFVIFPLSWLILLILLGEYQRLKRIGKFLVRVEKYINKKLSSTVLDWETHLEKQQLHIRYPYVASLVVFLGLGTISLCLGVFLLNNSLISKISLTIMILIIQIITSLYIIKRILKTYSV